MRRMRRRVSVEKNRVINPPKSVRNTSTRAGSEELSFASAEARDNPSCLRSRSPLSRHDAPVHLDRFHDPITTAGVCRIRESSLIPHTQMGRQPLLASTPFALPAPHPLHYTLPPRLHFPFSSPSPSQEWGSVGALRTPCSRNWI